MPHRPTLFGVKIGIKGKRSDSAKDTNTNAATNTPSKSEPQNEVASTTTVDSAPSTPKRTISVGSQKQQLPQNDPPVSEIDINNGDGMNTESCRDSDITNTNTEKKQSTSTNDTAIEKKMRLTTPEKREERSDEPMMILTKDEETSWQAPNASAATSVERKVLKIEGDDSPPFRNYKKENTKRSTSTFKARPLPNMTAPPSIPPTRYEATRSSSDLPRHQHNNGPDVPLGRNISLYRLADDNQSVSSAHLAGKIIRSSSRSSRSAHSFQARPMPKFNEAPKVPVRQQRGPMRSEWLATAKWETAGQ